MKIKLLVKGGEAKAGPSLGQVLGPTGIPMPKVISEVNEKTKAFAGLDVPVEVDINVAEKTFSVNVGSPTTSSLIRKESKDGDVKLEKLLQIVKIKEKNLSGTNLKKKLKEVVGTCKSMGLKVEGKDPKEVLNEIDSGAYKE